MYWMLNKRWTVLSLVVLVATIWYYNDGEMFVTMGSNESSMQAVVREWGKMVFKSQYNVPQNGPNEVLVRVQAAAINPVDYKAPRIILGKVVGMDVSGIIESVGANVTQFAVGDEVYGGAMGTLADFVVTKPDKIALKPKSISFAEAAAMPITYLTSLQGLRDYGDLKKGERLLVIGASGGCGIAALQLAKAMQAGKIVGVCSGKNVDLVKHHGADEVIDYTQHNVVNYFRNGATTGDIDSALKFDVIYDAATNSGGGVDYKDSAYQLLSQGDNTHGQYVVITGGLSMWLRFFTIGQKKNEHWFLANMNVADLEYLSKLVDDGSKPVKPVIAKLFPFNAENVVKGFELLKSRRAVGKVVFDMTTKQ